MNSIPIHLVIIIILVTIFSSCNNNKKAPSPYQVIIEKDTVYIVSKDTIYTSSNNIKKEIQPNTTKKSIAYKHDTITSKKEILNSKPTTKSNTTITTDIIVYYKGTKIISTLTTPWKNEKRIIQFFDKLGNKTYEIEDIKHSYTSITTLRYHEDSSVIDALTHLNPGASMYWYETTTRFEKNNEPTFQETTEYPEKLSALNNDKLKTWDKVNKKWN